MRFLALAYLCRFGMVAGASWEFAAHISGTARKPAGGYGYSDIQLLSDGSVGIAYQKTFNPYVGTIEGGGYDLAFAQIRTEGRDST